MSLLFDIFVEVKVSGFMCNKCCNNLGRSSRAIAARTLIFYYNKINAAINKTFILLTHLLPHLFYFILFCFILF